MPACERDRMGARRQCGSGSWKSSERRGSPKDRGLLPLRHDAPGSNLSRPTVGCAFSRDLGWRSCQSYVGIVSALRLRNGQIGSNGIIIPRTRYCLGATRPPNAGEYPALTASPGSQLHAFLRHAIRATCSASVPPGGLPGQGHSLTMNTEVAALRENMAQRGWTAVQRLALVPPRMRSAPEGATGYWCGVTRSPLRHTGTRTGGPR